MRWLDRLLPSAECTLCRRPVRPGPPWACRACLARIPRVQPPVCRDCGRPLRSPAADGGRERGAAPPRGSSAAGRSGSGDAGALRCRFCRVRPPFAWSVHLGPYDGALRSSIQLLKFESRREIARTLGALLAERIVAERRRLSRRSVVVPIPLHAERLARRGYNQAELLAEAVAAGLGLRLAPALRRLRPTRSQVGLSVRERRQNLAGAFEVAAPAEVAGCDAIIVDDVYTTGVTAAEAAFALLRSGAASTAVACAAVTVAEADLRGER